jgi:hypothetical protein
MFHELLPLFWDNIWVPCKWLKYFSDKILPKLKSELSPCLGCHLPEKLECLWFHVFLQLQVFMHILIKQVSLFIIAWFFEFWQVQKYLLSSNEPRKRPEPMILSQ